MRLRARPGARRRDTILLRPTVSSLSTLVQIRPPSLLIGAGHIKRTEKGELSVVVKEWTMLTKPLLPLPDKWHGLSDVETRYRKRYIDMIVTPGVTDTLRARSKTIATLRRVLEERDFLEV